MAAGGSTWGTSGSLGVGNSNTFNLSSVTEVFNDDDPDNPNNHAYWTFTATEAAYWTVDSFASLDGGTGDGDTKLSAYRGGTSIATATRIAYEDDSLEVLQSRIGFNVAPGDVIHVMAGTYDSDPAPLTRYVLTAAFVIPDPDNVSTAVPDTITLLAGGAFPLSGTGLTGGAGALADESDASYAQASRHLNDDFSHVTDYIELAFTTPVGCGGATVDQVTPRLRVQLDDDVASPHETMVRVAFSSVTFDPQLNEAFIGSLPTHSTIYDEGIPYDPSGEVLIGPKHYWEYQGEAFLNDPWPRITAALAAGDLIVTINKDTNVSTEGQWIDGWVRVFEFSLTVPEAAVPPEEPPPPPVEVEQQTRRHFFPV